MGEEEKRAALIRQKLLVDDSAVFERVVERAKPLLMLDTHGTVHLRVRRTSLNHRQLIGLALTGKKLSHMGGLAKEESASVEELSETTGASLAVVSARLAELRRDRLVESLRRGHWRIASPRMEDVLDEIDLALHGKTGEGDKAA